MDRERFARVLRLRWLWFKWKHKERAWNGLDLPCDRRDRDLFDASTIITVRDGKTAVFWTSTWIQGTSPRNLAPTLFQKAKRKKISVQKAIQDNRWISHILPIQTPQEIQEYIVLWEHVQGTRLQEDAEDTIRWRWTNDGEYIYIQECIPNSVSRIL